MSQTGLGTCVDKGSLYKGQVGLFEDSQDAVHQKSWESHATFDEGLNLVKTFGMFHPSQLCGDSFINI